MCSEKQRAANAENARLSTGPTTEAGKFRSKLNSWKDGRYARNPFLTPDEKDKHLRAVQRTYLEYFRPTTDYELRQVMAAAGLEWRLQRYARIESEIIEIHGFQRQFPGQAPGNELDYQGDAWAVVHDAFKAKSLLASSLIEDRLFRHLRQLKCELEKMRQRNLAKEPLRAAAKTEPPEESGAKIPSEGAV